MRITRFVNGVKINKPLNSEIIIKNDVISSTIDRVNRRLKTNSIIANDASEEIRR